MPIMIRKFYLLPEPEKGCNAIYLMHCDISTLTIEAQPGHVDGYSDPTQPVPDDAPFVPDYDIRPRHERVRDRQHFLDWLAAAKAGGHFGAEDSDTQQSVSGLLRYLWEQRASDLNE